MNDDSISFRREAFRFAAARVSFAALAFLLGAIAMAGWVVAQPHWRSLFVRGSEMKANTALCLMFLGLAVGLREWKSARRSQRFISYFGLTLVTAVGALTLVEYFTNWNLGLDELFFRDVPNAVGTSYPGRMSPPTAWCFLFGALGLATLDRRPRLAQWMALAMAFVPAHILLSYLYGNMNVLAFGSRHSYMAVPTAAGLIAVALGILLSAPHRGLMQTLTARTQASRVFRRLLVALLAVPPLLGWIVLVAFGGNRNPPEFGVSTTVMLCIAILAAVVWFNAARLNRAEHTLRESEDRYRLILENALEYAIFTVDQEGRVTSWNAGAQRILGYEENEILGRRLDVIFNSEDRERGQLDLEMGRALTNGRAQDERWHVRKDGSPLWATGLMMPLKDEEGRHLGYLKILRDRTNRKHNEETIRENEERFRLLIEGAPSSMLMVDGTGAITLINGQTEKLFGYSRDELLGQPVEILVPERYRGNHPQHRAGFLQTPSSRPMGAGRDLFGLRKDGTEVPIEIGLNPLRIGERRFVLASIIDITERKRAAAALRESEERFALFMKHLPGAAWMKDTQGHYVFANTTGEQVFRTPLSDLCGKTDEEIFPPEIAAQFRANDRRALEGGQGIQTIETLPQPDGVHYSVVSKFPIFNLEGKPILVGGVAFDITERKRAEELLRDQSNFTRSITDTAPVALFRLDAKNCITFANPAAARMFGWSESELIGRRLHDTLHHHDPAGRPYPAEECPIVAAGLRGMLLQDHEDVYFRKDGKPVNVLCSTAPIRTDGMNEGSVLAVQDITERKRAEETIRGHEAQIRLITDTTPVMLTRCGRDRRYEFVNRAYADMLGLPPEQLIGRPIAEVIGEAAYATIRPYVETVLQGRPVEYEAEVPFQRVGPHFLRAAYVPDRDSTGAVRGWIASLSDITDRKLAEERLTRLNETLLSMLEAIPDIFFVTETNGRIQFKNPAADRFANSIDMGGQLPPSIQVELEHVLQTGEHHLPTSLKTVHRFVIDREERFFLSRIVSITTPDERAFGAVVMLQDVTEFRLLDEVKTNLISTVSHELKTPMTSLRTALLLLLEQSVGPLNAEQAEMAGIARDETERLLRTLNELLDLTRFEESAVGMRLETVSPAELIQAAVEETRMVAEASRVSVKQECSPELPAVRADRERIVHVLTNFLTNAIKYSPDGGEIVVRAATQDQEVGFSVLDRGPGVPRQYQSRIFEKFVRVPGNPKKGVGLGLSIAREFVRAHRGRIGVRSDPGEGSEFYFILPLN